MDNCGEKVREEKRKQGIRRRVPGVPDMGLAGIAPVTHLLSGSCRLPLWSFGLRMTRAPIGAARLHS